ncbi:MAG: hypothetical protein JXR14_13455 [Paracoccaceae bacterium]
MNTAPQSELSIVTARNSTRTVLFLRKSKMLTCCILWDRKDDSFEIGQWIKAKLWGAVLSPDGRHMLYCAANYKWANAGRGEWTALSRPPYFTALGFYPDASVLGGGGGFLTDRCFWVDYYDRGQGLNSMARGLERVFRDEVTTGNAVGFVTADGSRVPLPREIRRDLLAGKDPRQSEIPEDIEVEQDRLYRITDGKRILIRDFSDLAFDFVRAPYDTRPDRRPDDPVAWQSPGGGAG